MDEGRPTFISLFVFLKSQKCILNVGVIFQESPVTLTFRKIESNLSNAAHSNKKSINCLLAYNSIYLRYFIGI